MRPANSDPRIPEELTKLSDQTRVLVRRSGVPREDGKCVVYWMQRAMRIVDNPALDIALETANLLDLPVVVYFQVIQNYPNANLRHYHFLQQGLRDVEQDAAERDVGFVLRRSPEHSLEEFLEEVNAALLIGDENPCREPERWRQVLAKRLKIPFWTVDADVVVPSRIFDRSFVLLHHFRPHLKAQLPNFLVEPRNITPQYSCKPWKRLESFSLKQDITTGFSKLDRKVRPVDSFTGGAHAALERLREGNFSAVKGIGAGVCELRLDFGPGYRVYLVKDGERLVILLGGGTKKRQQTNIDAAKVLWQEYKLQKREE